MNLVRVLLLFCVASAAHAAQQSLPIISVNGCVEVCSSTSTAGFTPACAQCLLDRRAIKNWSSRDIVNPRLERLPLAEWGLPRQAAMPMVGPDSLSPSNPNTLAFALSAVGNDNWGTAGPANGVTVCLANGTCINRRMASTMASLGNLTIPCVRKQGWLTPAQMPACPGVKLTLREVPFNTPDQLAAFMLTTKGVESYMPVVQREAVEMMTDVTKAADSIWAVAHLGTSSALLFKNISNAVDLAALKALYPSDWLADYDLLYAAGNLVVMDLTLHQGIMSSAGHWNVVAHVILEYLPAIPGRPVTLRALAIRLSNAPADPVAFQVFTPAKSPTAFILAAAITRMCMTQFQIWVGHYANQHKLSGAIAYALYNVFEPGVPVGQAKTPLRQMLDPFMDPYWSQGFNTALYTEMIFPPPVAIMPADLPLIHEAYVTKGPLGTGTNTWHSLTISEQLRRSGLHPDRFVGSDGSAWGAYPDAHFDLALEAVCRRYAQRVVSTYFLDDAAVANHAGIQRLVTVMLDPKASNLMQISADNKLDTRSKLAEFLSANVFVVMAHNTGHLIDFGQRLGSMIHHPEHLESKVMPDPMATFTMQQMMDYLPNSRTYSVAAAFLTYFYASRPLNQLVPSVGGVRGAAPAWDAELPFPKRTLQGRIANQALITFRQEISQLLATYPLGLMRFTNSNWMSPSQIPRTMNL